MILSDECGHSHLPEDLLRKQILILWFKLLLGLFGGTVFGLLGFGFGVVFLAHNLFCYWLFNIHSLPKSSGDTGLPYLAWF